jgi:hypothetical protein
MRAVSTAVLRRRTRAFETRAECFLVVRHSALYPASTQVHEIRMEGVKMLKEQCLLLQLQRSIRELLSALLDCCLFGRMLFLSCFLLVDGFAFPLELMTRTLCLDRVEGLSFAGASHIAD